MVLAWALEAGGGHLNDKVSLLRRGLAVFFLQLGGSFCVGEILAKISLFVILSN